MKKIILIIALALTPVVNASVPVLYYRALPKNMQPSPSKKLISRAVREGKDLYLVGTIKQLLLIGGGIEEENTFRWKARKDEPNFNFFAKIDCTSYWFWPKNILWVVSVFLEKTD